MSSSPSRVLIADDDTASSQLLQVVMTAFGFETTLVFDGQGALEEISKRPYDLIFLDKNMPGLNGPEILAKIEEVRLQRLKNGVRWQVLPVVTYSSCDVDDYKIPNQSGFYIVGHWQKPITLPEMTTLTGSTMTQLGLRGNSSDF